MRAAEPGWKRIGRYDTPRRRALWYRRSGYADGQVVEVEICAGREGDDSYAKFHAGSPAFEAILDVFETAAYPEEMGHDGEGEADAYQETIRKLQDHLVEKEAELAAAQEKIEALELALREAEVEADHWAEVGG